MEQIPNTPLLLGRYRPLRLLARGGSSSVYVGRDESIGRDIAIKLFSAGGAPDVDRFRDELRVLASLGHHGVIAIIDAGIDDSTPTDPRPFLIMELVCGRSLRDLLDERRPTAQEIGGIAFEIAEALDYVHFRGVIHRDISPSNIMITDYGSPSARPRALLTDFGIAISSSLSADAEPAEANSVTGTLAYVSPEQVTGQPISTAADIYALGLVLLESFTGRLEYSGTPIESALARVSRNPSIPSEIPQRWRRLLSEMLDPQASLRPAAADVVESVRAALR